MSNQTNSNAQPAEKKNALLSVVVPVFFLFVFLGLIGVASSKLMGDRNNDYAEKVKAKMEKQEAAKKAEKADTKTIEKS